jgi:cytochrome c oxidase subunit 2
VTYGARTWLPPVASRHGAGIDAMLLYLLLTVGTLFFVGHIALGILIWRAAARGRVTRRMASGKTEWRLSTSLGVLTALIAEAGVLAIGIPVWQQYYVPTPPPDAVTVEVTGQQFMWNIRYPGDDGTFGRTDVTLVDDTSNPLGIDPADPAGADDLVTTNEMAVPVDRPIRLRLRSKDVIHSFFLPHLRVKQDAVPGMTPEVQFVPTREGDFEIACTELCGLGHYRMQGVLRVMTDAGYRQWLADQRAAGF